MKIEKLIDKISKLTIREVESEELQQPIARSYEELINELSTSIDEEFSKEAIEMIKRSIAVLIQHRIEKILKKIVNGEDIQRKLLYMEERRILKIFEKIDEILKRHGERRTVEKIEIVSGELTLLCMRDFFPAIQTSRMERLGPFSKYDIITLPADDASELVRKGIADVLRL